MNRVADLRPQTPMFASRSSRAQNLTLLAGSLCFSLIVGEIIARALSLAPDYKFYPGICTTAPGYDLRLKRNYSGVQGKVPMRTSNLGLRNPPVFEKRTTESRILFLGDSVTFGWGVPDEDVFPRLIEGELRNHGRDVVVINAAVIGFSTWDQLRYLELDGMELGPDLVVVCVSNNDNLQREWVVNDRGTLTMRGTTQLRNRVTEGLFNNEFLSRHSEFYRAVKNAARNYIYAARTQSLRESIGDDSATASNVPQPWRTVINQLERMAHLLERGDQGLLVVDFTGVPGLAGRIRERGLEVIARDLPSGPEFTLPGDGHPNRQGHEWIADELFGEILTRLSTVESGS
ncbi:MAG: hypothetical protein JSW67_14995 [Candidatus Latescibacterota bacterium]|nr:MAG: hypothetical protein JSW67_14995 [Candidatus Latescibacterota bacterium]